MSARHYMSYEEFGRKFFEVAVTEARVEAAFAAVAGDQFEMGPMGQGPGKLAKISVKVKIGEPEVTRHVGDTITFAIRIPLAIELMVDLWIDKQRFLVDGEIGLRAKARAAAPLLLTLDVAKPSPADIAVHVRSSSIRGEVLRLLAGVDDEIRRFIAQHVSDLIDQPDSQAAQVIDVAEQLDTAWTGV